MVDSDCGQAFDPCSTSVCEKGACLLVPEPSGQPPQKAGDCSEVVCSGGSSIEITDEADLPAALGVCDAPACGPMGPQHVDDSSLCSLVEGCKAGQCECLPCPNGTVVGLPEGACRFPKSTGAASSVPSLNKPPTNTVDGAVTTTWQPGFGGQSDATLTLSLPSPTPMRSLLILPDFSAASGTATFTYAVTLTVAGSTLVLPPVQVVVMENGPAPVPIELPAPAVVTKVKLRVTTNKTSLAVYEVAYRTCP
jgi:hypothetical protein